MAEEKNNEGNEPITPSKEINEQTLQYDNHDVNVLTDQEGNLKRIEIPEEKQDDTEWQNKCKDAISAAAAANKNNLETKKEAEKVETSTKKLTEALDNLKSLGTPSDDEFNFNVKSEIRKELNLDEHDSLVDVDDSDLSKAEDKVQKRYEKALREHTTKGVASKDLVKKITDEQTPSRIASFSKFVKDLGVSTVTEGMYNIWKKSNPTTSTKKESQKLLSEMGGDDVEIVPFGTPRSFTTAEKQHNQNVKTVLGNIGKV